MTSNNNPTLNCLKFILYGVSKTALNGFTDAGLNQFQGVRTRRKERSRSYLSADADPEITWKFFNGSGEVA